MFRLGFMAVCLLSFGLHGVAAEPPRPRTVFAYRDHEDRAGCFVHLHGPDWIELTPSGDKFQFKHVTDKEGGIELFDKSRDGVGVRLFAEKSEWKANQGTKGIWEPLWNGAWRSSADLRPQFKKLGLNPVNQGERGTCSVFTVHSALDFAFSRSLNRPVQCSVEYLNWAANHATGHATDGQYFHDVLAGLHRFGVCHDSDMPYTAKFDAALAPSKKARDDARKLHAVFAKQLRVNWISPLKKKPGLTRGQMHEIKGVLAKGWPVASGASHSRLLVGFQDDPQQPGGGRFFDLDSGTGHWETVTYEFVHTNVDDVFWIEATVKALPEQ